jgi:ribose/xylose/arabinose/galactoside ABC-type transport system permease subunit
MNLKMNLIYKIIDKYAIVLIVIVFTIFLTIVSPVFFTLENFYNIIRQIAVLGFLSIGETFVILMGEIDLSVGSVLALSSVIIATLLKAGMPIWSSVGITLIIGGLIGALSGILISKLKAPSFIISLAMMSIAHGLTLVVTKGLQISFLPEKYGFIGGGYIWGTPTPMWILFFVAAVAIIVTSKTKTGRHIYAIGGNRRSAFYCGINVNKYIILVFCISGFCSAIGAIVDTSRINAATAVSGEGYELQAISAVIVGGTYIFGGKGTVLGTLIGVLFLGEITNSIVLLQVTVYYTQIFYGCILVLSIVLDALRRRFGKGSSTIVNYVRKEV